MMFVSLSVIQVLFRSLIYTAVIAEGCSDPVALKSLHVPDNHDFSAMLNVHMTSQYS